MRIKLNFLEFKKIDIRSISNRNIEDNPALLNGIAIGKSSILLAAGGWDAVLSINTLGEVQALHGGKKGVGNNHFKEPVGIFLSPKNLIYVADWHNHRIVILDYNLDYLDEFGYLSNLDESGALVKKLFRYASNLWNSGSYVRSHFNHSVYCSDKFQSKHINFPSGIYDQVKRHNGFFSWLKYIIYSDHGMNKPNGIAFTDSYLVVTQKNNRCISVYKKDSPYSLVKHIFCPRPGVKFGRLGNVIYKDYRFYICDERENVIWVLSHDFSFISELKGVSSGTPENKFLPFSCCLIDKNHLVVCGGRNIQIINTITSEVVAISQCYGELHGIVYDSSDSILYVVDRLHSQLLTFKVTSAQ